MTRHEIEAAMSRHGVLTQTLFAAALTIALGVGEGALGQEPPAANAAAAADPSVTPSDEPRRRRERRRDAEAAEAAEAAPTATTANTALAETVEAKIICKSVKPIGSRVARRVCGTEEQWAAANQRTNEETEEGLRQFRNRAGVAGGGSGPASLNTPAGL